MKTAYYSILVCVVVLFCTNINLARHHDQTMVQSQQGVSEVKSATHLADMLKNHEWAVVKFYSTRCTHCKHYGPEFIKAARHEDMNDVQFIAVNVDEHPDLAQKHHIGGLPTTLIIHNTKKVDEFGGNTEASKVVKNVKRAMKK